MLTREMLASLAEIPGAVMEVVTPQYKATVFYYNTAFRVVVEPEESECPLCACEARWGRHKHIVYRYEAVDRLNRIASNGRVEIHPPKETIVATVRREYLYNPAEQFREYYIFECGCDLKGVSHSHGSAGWTDMVWMPCQKHEHVFNDWGPLYPDEIFEAFYQRGIAVLLQYE
jgi:hypothetical protein